MLKHILLALIIGTLSGFGLWASSYNDAEAAEIRCYDSGIKIYDGQGKNIYYNGEYLFFTEIGSNKNIATFADCLIRNLQEPRIHNGVKIHAPKAR